jgi:hypothetical protein
MQTGLETPRVECDCDLTPIPFRCPACGTDSRMCIVWPFWTCPICEARLIPADLPQIDAPFLGEGL